MWTCLFEACFHFQQMLMHGLACRFGITGYDRLDDDDDDDDVYM
jgi:hypothetical protein